MRMPGLDLIKEFEGFRGSAYPDPRTNGEPITIGYGTTRYSDKLAKRFGRSKVELGDLITLEEAEYELNHRVTLFDMDIRSEYPTIELTELQWVAVRSFVYNLGMAGSALQLERLARGDHALYAAKLHEYINKGTSVEAGLRRRRLAEYKLFMEGMEMSEATWIQLVRQEDGGQVEDWAYAMRGDELVGSMQWRTRGEFDEFLKKHRSAGSVRVGPLNWEVPKADTGIATLTRTGEKEAAGCEILELVIGDDKFRCRSGQPWAQVFQKGGPDNRPGSMMPLPSGDYGLGGVEFAGGRDNYNVSFGEGLGPVWVGLTPRFDTRRSAFGIHQDTGAYGTAGCVGLFNVADLTRFVKAMRDHSPKVLRVKW